MRPQGFIVSFGFVSIPSSHQKIVLFLLSQSLWLSPLFFLALLYWLGLPIQISSGIYCHKCLLMENALSFFFFLIQKCFYLFLWLHYAARAWTHACSGNMKSFQYLLDHQESPFYTIAFSWHRSIAVIPLAPPLSNVYLSYLSSPYNPNGQKNKNIFCYSVNPKEAINGRYWSMAFNTKPDGAENTMCCPYTIRLYHSSQSHTISSYHQPHSLHLRFPLASRPTLSIHIRI